MIMYKLVKAGGGVGENIYDAAASYGRIKTSITSVVMVFIALLCVFFGIKVMVSKDAYSGKARATVVNPDCRDFTNSGGKGVQCALDVTYTVDGRTFKKVIDESGRNYKAGDVLEIRYNPLNPIETTTSWTKLAIGLIIIVVGILLALFAWLSWMITQKSKFGASLVAANDAIDIFRD